jgi:hypothetical protein
MTISDTLRRWYDKARHAFGLHSADFDRAVDKGINALDKGVDKAKTTVGERADDIKSTIEKGAGKVDDLTKGKVSAHIDRAANAAKTAVDKFGKTSPTDPPTDPPAGSK